MHEDRGRPYLQRLLDASNATRGYRIEDLEEKAEQGIPAIIQTRTYPEYVGHEQAYAGRP